MNKASANRLISKCKSWADFTAAVEKLDKKQMGDIFERLTQLYLQTKSEYKTTLKNVWLYSEIPARVRKKIKSLPVADEGIDLVAETKDGEFWAIQSKYRTDKDKPLTYKELSTFTNLAFNTCKGSFAQAIVVHSVSKPVKKRKLLGNTVEIGLQRWLEMDAGHWTLIRRTIGNKPARPKKRTPRPHQRKAIRSAAKHFIDFKEPRGKLIMPCGTGKSLTAFWIANKLDAKTVLLVVPSLALIKQSVEDWTQEMVARGEDNLTEWLCICSDDSAGSVNKDDFVSDIYATGLPVTTDAKKIGAFLKKRTKRRKIVFVTYQSSPVFAKAARRAGAKFDLAVMDEAHKTAGEKSKAFATLLFDKNLPIKKRIFMTATERVMRGANDEVVSMDKVDIYGDCFYQLSFKEAIHSDPPIISDYRILTIFVTEDEIRSAIKDRQFVSDRKYKLDAKDSRELASAIALRKAYKKYRIKHAVSFHRSIQGASDFSDLHETLNASTSLRPKVECFHVSSKKTTGQRTQLLKDFADSKRSLITNARCLTEGVDVPAIDCVLFADPKQSTVDIVQAAGRVLRPHADKKFGYIMLPIIVPKGKTVDKFAETTEFKTVSRVITALSTNDERIAEEFRVVERGKKRRGEIVRFDGNVPVGMKIDFEAFADAISAKVWERAAKVNWRSYEDAREYARRLNLKTGKEWTAFTKSGNLPDDIPSYPDHVYRFQGWVSIGDWLGNFRVANQNKTFMEFGRARNFVHSLKIATVDEWRQYCRGELRNLPPLPTDIPKVPRNLYKNEGWCGYQDWLGTKIGKQEFRSFAKAHAFARRLQLKSIGEWQQYCRGELNEKPPKPDDIPVSPRQAYLEKGWKGNGDWLGTRMGPRVHRPFEEARLFVRGLKLKNSLEWKKYCAGELAGMPPLPADIPRTPRRKYKDDGWVGMSDWLGTGRNPPKSSRPFEKARKFSRSLKLNNMKEWRQYCRGDRKNKPALPLDIPRHPNDVYRNDGWKSWADWLDTKNTWKKKFRSFEKARKFARSLNLKKQKEWRQYCRGEIRNKTKRPEDIPGNPGQTYVNDGWIGFPDWLGTQYVPTQSRSYLTYRKARSFVRSLCLKNQNEWRLYCKSEMRGMPKKPDNIPANPGSAYKGKGWNSVSDWLGTRNLHPTRINFMSFKDAREFARGLGLLSSTDWHRYIAGKIPHAPKRPLEVPANPRSKYKNFGWKDWQDWLGVELKKKS